MSWARAFAALAILGAAGCGNDPAPQAPVKAAAPPTPAPAASGKPNEAACNELLLGIAAMNTLRTEQSALDAAAGTVRAGRHALRVFAEYRASLKRAADLDPRLTADAEQVDSAMAGPSTVLDAQMKAREAHSKAMREIVGDIERLRAPFATCAPKKDADCASKKAVDVAIDRAIWNSVLLPRTQGEIDKVPFKSADLDARRVQLSKRVGDAETALMDEQKQADVLRTGTEDQNKVLAKAIEPLYARCGIEHTDAADMALRRTDWITSKEPDLRKMVIVVKVVPEGRVRSRLDDWAAASTGIQREAFDGAARGGFGSGFFVMPRPGEALVVTNRHVVDFGDHATLVLPDGSLMGAEILYTDPRADLAVLKPAKTTVTYGLGLEPVAPKDQQVVIATGYPGLGAAPSYQTTRGYVSNQRFVDTFDNATYIQHTAPIDRGNSGGPLTTERFSVVGVNTLKVLQRDNVAMSVPASAVADAVVHAEAKPDAAGLREDARAACLDVVAEVSAIRPRISALFQRISLAMVAESGSSSFNREASTDSALSQLILEEPIDALRYAIIDRLTHEARVARLNPFETCSTPNPDDWEHIETMDRVRFQVRAGADLKELVLRREHGRFQLLRFDLLPAPADPVKPAKKSKAAKKAQAAQK